VGMLTPLNTPEALKSPEPLADEEFDKSHTLPSRQDWFRAKRNSP